MADNSVLSDLTSSLGKALPYALSAALGAGMGGGALGALAGVGMAKGGEAQYEISKSKAGIEAEKLGLEKQRIESDEALKQATIENTQQFRQSSQSLQRASLDQRIAAFKQSIIDKSNSQQGLEAYRQQMVALGQQQKNIELQILQARNTDDAAKLQQQRGEAIQMRIAGVDAHARNMANDAVKDQGWMKTLTGKTNSTYDEAYKTAYADGLRSLGISKDDALNRGADPDAVAKAYPESTAGKPLVAKGKSPGQPLQSKAAKDADAYLKKFGS
jgi:hypothetical protein